MSATPTLTTERIDNGEGSRATLLVRLDDGKANALSKELIAAISAAINDAAADPDLGAVVIAGREGRFSGGFDLGVMMSGDIAAMVDLVADGGDLVRNVFRSDVPIVAACTGHALAAGALLLLGCDVRVGATGDYKIGLNEVAIGMVLPAWGMTIAQERLSKRHLQRSVSNARIVDPDSAVDAGFLDVVVDQTAVVGRAIAEAAVLATTLDPAAYAGTMTQFRGAVADTMSAQIAADRARA
ncbi:MAG: crotonase/enoyl-CoA hydratase family protein [Acidimicrobiales bacterium]